MKRAARGSSFATRVRAALFLAAAVCIGVTAGAFYLLWSRQTLSVRTAELRRQVSVVAAGIAVSDVLPGSVNDTDQVRARLLNIEAGLTGARLAVADGSGSVLFGTGAPGVTRYPVSQLASGTSEAAQRIGVVAVAGSGRELIVAIPVSFGQAGGPDRYVIGARSLSDVGAADQWVAIAILAAAAVGLVVAWLVGTLLATQVTRPLRRLTEGARDIAAGGWGRQVPIEGRGEAAELAGAFNAMSARVAAAYRAQQAFVGDVSHEIRTPVTSIRGFADAIADGTVRDEAGVKRAAGIIASEASRLAEITTALLSLADLEAGAVALASERVATGPIAADLRDRFELIARDRGVTLEVEMSGDGPVADPARVLQVLSTLVENALAHALGSVRVRAHRTGPLWVATVDDDGPGIPKADRERVFDRFTRLDAARTRGGSGLGLAIARRLVEMMGGTVHAEAAPVLGGARFVVDLPATSGAATAGSIQTQSAGNPPPTPAADTDTVSGHRSAPAHDARESSR